MRAPLLTTISLCLLTGPLLAEHPTGDESRVAFDNRSSSNVTVYRRTSLGEYKAYASLAPGEAYATLSESGQLWTVAAPHYYRVVDSIEAGAGRGWAGRRVVVTDQKLNAIGTTRLRMTFANRTGRRVDLFKVVDGDEVAWSRLERSQSRAYYSYQGREWIARDAQTGAVLDRLTIGSRSGTVALEIERDSRSDRRPGGWIERQPAELITLVVTNRSARTVSVSKRTTFGSRTLGTVGPGRTARAETAPGDVWRIEDAETFEVLETITVTSGAAECPVDIAPTTPAPRPAPEPARKITMRFYNDTPEIIYIYKRKDGSWKYTKRIYPARFYDLEFYPGQKISVRDPDSGREIEALRAPSANRVVRVSPHGDHAHVETVRPDAHDHETTPPAPEPEGERGGPPRPRELLRRILGRN